MNIDAIIHNVSVVIANAAPVTYGTYELVVIDQKIYLRIRRLSNEPFPLLAYLESAQINNGLSPDLWGYIKRQISVFHSKGILK